MQLDHKTAVVTGAGRNIGEAIARELVARGGRVAVVDRDGGRAERVAGDLNQTRDGSALAVQADVTLDSDVQRMVTAAREQWGEIDILVNNVGVVDRTNVLELPETEWDRIIAITLKSVFLCTKHVGNAMVAAGRGGCIVNIASTSAHQSRV